MYKESSFWGLLFLVAVLCLLIGALVTARKRHAVLVVLPLMLALAVEAVNSYLGAKVNAANASQRHAGFANVLYRTAPTLPFHLVALVLLVLAAVLVPMPSISSPRRTKRAQEKLNT